MFINSSRLVVIIDGRPKEQLLRFNLSRKCAVADLGISSWAATWQANVHTQLSRTFTAISQSHLRPLI